MSWSRYLSPIANARVIFHRGNDVAVRWYEDKGDGKYVVTNPPLEAKISRECVLAANVGKGTNFSIKTRSRMDKKLAKVLRRE